MSIGDGIAVAGLAIAFAAYLIFDVKIYIKWPSDLTINHNYKKEDKANG